MVVAELLLVLLALLGNSAIWFAIFNQLHARALPCRVLKITTPTTYAAVVAIPLLFAGWYFFGDGRPLLSVWNRPGQMLPAIYVGICVVTALVAIPVWLIRMFERPTAALTANHTTHVDIRKRLGDDYFGSPWVTRFARLPGNQLLHLSIHENEIKISRLATALDGFTIAHLSDFHFKGGVGKPYFEDVVRESNKLDADLVAVTGDLVDNLACLDWIPDTFAKLEARCGVYFVLGNHDAWHDPDLIRRRLTDCGLVCLSGTWTQIETRGQRIVLAGNELPWLAPAADLENAPPRDERGEPLRILLAHSPDQFSWARNHDVDLMLAGHTHGGQIRLPWVGPVVSPSRKGTRYAAGTYHEGPTVMHVSRGISSSFMIRYNCPPELTKMTLRSPG